VLVDLEGYSVEDAAAMLQVATGTIKSRCARGRARLLPLVAHLRGDGSLIERPSAGSAAKNAGARTPRGDHMVGEVTKRSPSGGNQPDVADVASATGSAPRAVEEGDRRQ
jgi:RNA polymerase sigma-70 factor (ECF subfamily)